MHRFILLTLVVWGCSIDRYNVRANARYDLDCGKVTWRNTDENTKVATGCDEEATYKRECKNSKKQCIWVLSKRSTFSRFTKNVNILKSLSSEYREFGQVLSANGKTIFFVREGDPRNIGYEKRRNDQDVWMSTKISGKWSTPIQLPEPINTLTYDHPIGCSADGKILYSYGYYRKGVKRKLNGGISVFRFKTNKWLFWRVLLIEGYYNLSGGHDLRLSPDGRFLLVSQQRKDSLGKNDIYVYEKKSNKEYTFKTNLGPIINSNFHEGGPTLWKDNKTLYYFKYDVPGHPLDFGSIYVSYRLDDSWQNWSKPRKLAGNARSWITDYDLQIEPDGIHAIISRGATRVDFIRVKLEPKDRPTNITKSLRDQQ